MLSSGPTLDSNRGAEPAAPVIPKYHRRDECQQEEKEEEVQALASHHPEEWIPAIHMLSEKSPRAGRKKIEKKRSLSVTLEFCCASRQPGRACSQRHRDARSRPGRADFG
jgi:hypothetical protein